MYCAEVRASTEVGAAINFNSLGLKMRLHHGEAGWSLVGVHNTRVTNRRSTSTNEVGAAVRKGDI